MTAKRPGAEMSKAQREKMKALEHSPVWYANCPRCKKHLQGTAIQLKEHICG